MRKAPLCSQEELYQCLRTAKLLGDTATINHIHVRTGPPVGVGIGSLPVTPNRNGEIGVLRVESDLAGVGQHNKT